MKQAPHCKVLLLLLLFSSLSDDRSKASSKIIPPQSMLRLFSRSSWPMLSQSGLTSRELRRSVCVNRQTCLSEIRGQGTTKIVCCNFIRSTKNHVTCRRRVKSRDTAL